MGGKLVDVGFLRFFCVEAPVTTAMVVLKTEQLWKRYASSPQPFILTRHALEQNPECCNLYMERLQCFDERILEDSCNILHHCAKDEIYGFRFHASRADSHCTFSPNQCLAKNKNLPFDISQTPDLCFLSGLFHSDASVHGYMCLRMFAHV